MWSSLWYYLRGYVRIRIKGRGIASFLDRASKSGIVIRHIQKDDSDECLFDLRPDCFKDLKRLEGCKNFSISINEKKGPLFPILKMKKRPMLIIGFGLCVCLICAMASRLSEIRIQGCFNVDANEILAAIKKDGISVGSSMEDIEPSDVEQRILTSVSGVSRAAVTVDATRLIIEIVEAKTSPAMLDNDVPSDIIADKQGIIREIFVYEGKPAVKAGDTVETGQVLVTGKITPEYVEGEGRMVHSRADISVSRWYTGMAFVKSTIDEWILTGRTEQKDFINIGPIDSISNSEFDEYEWDRAFEYRLDGFFFPVTVGTEQRRELALTQVTRDENQLKELASQAAWNKAVRDVPTDARIVDYNTTCTTNETGVVAVTVVEALEAIGQSVAITP